MKILDLTNQEKIGDLNLRYKISRFPDGQQSIDLEFTHFNDEVTINSRLNDFKDLEVILCATSALRNLGIKTIHLYVPYFLGARSDRKFSEGGINYLKEGMDVKVWFESDEPISAEAPATVELEVTYCEPGLKGDTATNTLKPSTLETGAKINVPLFINIGDKIKVDTKQHSYMERVKA